MPIEEGGPRYLFLVWEHDCRDKYDEVGFGKTDVLLSRYDAYGILNTSLCQTFRDIVRNNLYLPPAAVVFQLANVGYLACSNKATSFSNNQPVVLCGGR